MGAWEHGHGMSGRDATCAFDLARDRPFWRARRLFVSVWCCSASTVARGPERECAPEQWGRDSHTVWPKLRPSACKLTASAGCEVV